MFTIEQIQEAHSKVRSGADFPEYVQTLIRLAVSDYTTYVSNGQTVYRGKDGHHAETEAKYITLEIAESSDTEKFRTSLRMHQQGDTNYLTFCIHAAESGIEKWSVSMDTMTCTYYDKTGNTIVTEKIPTL